MKSVLPILLFFHGAIHLIGFLQAYKIIQIGQGNPEISKFAGILWLITFLLLLISGIAHLSKADWWYILAFLGILISSIVIVLSWEEAKYGTIANIIILAAVISGYGASAFYKVYKLDVRNGLRQTTAISESILVEDDIEHLPEPVKKYIRNSGAPGKPKLTNFRLEFKGQIRKDEQSEWMPFTTVQYNFLNTSTRLFFMKAVMKKLPVAGYHCFKNGEAFMDIRLFSLFKVQYQSGKEMGISETVTFFNDMCCMAPASLIDKRIKWIESDGNKVKAEFTNNNITIGAWLYFNDNGELVNFISDDRYASGENNTMQRFPWLTPVKEYKDVDGYNLPTYAEAIYSYPQGDFCYGIFRLSHINYNCTEFN